ncbi:MAG: rubrerythrin family protein [Chitinivibrionia bacterium]|jgi:rubrerythrin|nr:rubrerythrin family protein [Chitinivibrionia bacterium]
MASLKGTKTEQNLLKAFAGESQAKNRYTFFASAAKKEGYEQIAAAFAESAQNEEEHAKKFFKYLEGGCVEITAAFPAGVIGTTLENLEAAAGGEHEEWSDLYPEFARIAQEEGFSDVATTFKMIAVAEMAHEARYRKLHKNLSEGKVFKKDENITWKCRNCGFLHKNSESAPDLCPACKHPQAYFEVWVENY